MKKTKKNVNFFYNQNTSKIIFNKVNCDNLILRFFENAVLGYIIKIGEKKNMLSVTTVTTVTIVTAVINIATLAPVAIVISFTTITSAATVTSVATVPTVSIASMVTVNFLLLRLN